jgi:hypothetical protein
MYLIDLCRVGNIGKARARKLYDNDIKTVSELADLDPAKAKKLLNMKDDAVNAILSEAKQLDLAWISACLICAVLALVAVGAGRLAKSGFAVGEVDVRIPSRLISHPFFWDVNLVHGLESGPCLVNVFVATFEYIVKCLDVAATHPISVGAVTVCGFEHFSDRNRLAHMLPAQEQSVPVLRHSG